MSNRVGFIFILVVVIALSFPSCKKSVDPAFLTTSYPASVEKIIVTKCATAGCHNDKSYQNAANLNLSDWNKMLEGGVSGAVVIPFSPNQSSLMQFINTYDDLGIKASPTMPINEAPLFRNEVLTIRNWIKEGCPSKDGEIPFASNSTSRGKAYISNQGCDNVSVIDAETKLVMRYVKVGKDETQIEVPHCLRVSPDSKYWYVCFTNGSYVQKFDANADTLVSEVNIGAGSWNILKISPDSKNAFVSDFSNNGKLVELDLNTMTIKSTLSGSGLFSFPHGVAYTKTKDTLYITAQYGNMIYRVIPSIPQIDQLSIQKGVAPVTTPQLLDPHEIVMSPDYSRYFITCQASNELRVMDASADTLLRVVPMGLYPLEFAISPKKNLLFVCNQEDNNPIYPQFKGSIYVVDMSSFIVVKKIYEKFYQPHGIVVDDKRGLLYVSSRNADPTGPAPHHLSECNGRNGFFHVIDINTWKLVKPTSELSVDSYSMDVRE
jgi:YVTN family beta-propeller protein